MFIEKKSIPAKASDGRDDVSTSSSSWITEVYAFISLQSEVPHSHKRERALTHQQRYYTSVEVIFESKYLDYGFWLSKTVPGGGWWWKSGYHTL